MLFLLLNQVKPLPPKNSPVVPVILRTRYVGTFDMILDELEKIEVRKASFPEVVDFSVVYCGIIG